MAHVLDTRKKFRAVLEGKDDRFRGNRSVILNGRVVTRVEDLPDDTELAGLSQDDPARSDALLADIQAESNELKARLAKLEAAAAQQKPAKQPADKQNQEPSK